ncbi:polysaccharide deacetylase family protein [Armatimonas rosea]|uniref:Peptidoglycan/xylan/chitin deacetylase (PgdA/CDA1 family) n=1 Tax=Armatimonas rosea TaxID=685828 RepID=A0A7W9W8L5_ARMRO|nr:polysaccharide deacetylase family protein [Armatimonas rosea]MBB6052366.1 peptidoglycan/xylan/chitin deacetylase (PgdA/CDA1 family) [Armatimonas rosea]
MLLRRLPTTENVVALTFDACQTLKPAGYAPEIIAILRRERVPATLFLGGRWMEWHADVTRSLARDPLFELATHSYLHPHFPKLTEKQMRADLEQALAVHQKLTGRKPKAFRPPYGEQNPLTVKVAESYGLATVLWDVETGDPDPKSSAKEILREVSRQTKPGSIVIQHMNGRGWHSPEALPEIVALLRRRGFRFVQISESLHR